MALKERHGGYFKKAMCFIRGKLRNSIPVSPENVADKFDIDILKSAKLIQIATSLERSDKPMLNMDDIPEKDLGLILACKDPFGLCPELLASIGYDNFKKIISIFGGLHIDLPTVGDIHKHHKDILIYKKFKSGVPIGELTKEYGISDTMVLSVVASVDKAINYGYQTV